MSQVLSQQLKPLSYLVDNNSQTLKLNFVNPKHSKHKCLQDLENSLLKIETKQPTIVKALNTANENIKIINPKVPRIIRDLSVEELEQSIQYHQKKIRHIQEIVDNKYQELYMMSNTMDYNTINDDIIDLEGTIEDLRDDLRKLLMVYQNKK
jgi:tRNA U34 5-carboxymethylaminomethyl modifying enzyme MnmG/GidA